MMMIRSAIVSARGGRVPLMRKRVNCNGERGNPGEFSCGYHKYLPPGGRSTVLMASKLPVTCIKKFFAGYKRAEEDAIHFLI